MLGWRWGFLEALAQWVAQVSYRAPFREYRRLTHGTFVLVCHGVCGEQKDRFAISCVRPEALLTDGIRRPTAQQCVCLP